MKKLLSAAATLAATIGLAGSCDLLGGGGGFSIRRTGSEDMSSRNERDLSDSTEAEASALYVTGVEFAEGYDWHRDSSGGAEVCRILVFKDGKRILSVPAGGSANAASAPDMHRFIGGHLYTDYSSNTETIISRDGEELFRYGGREMMCGFLVRADGVYTLGQNRKGEGLSLRKDGTELFNAAVGRVIGDMENPCCESGALYEDAGDIVFCYRNSSETAGTAGYTAYYVVRGGKAEQLMMDKNIEYVYDIRYIGGVRHMVAKTSTSQILAYAGDKIVKLDESVGGRHQLANFRILSDGGKVFVKADRTYNLWDDSENSVIWDMSGDEYNTTQFHIALDFYVKDGAIAYPYTFGDIVNGIGIIDRDGNNDTYFVSGRYIMMGSACAVFKGEEFHVGLSPLDQGYPIVLRRENVADTLRFNGYITSVR